MKRHLCHPKALPPPPAPPPPGVKSVTQAQGRERFGHSPKSVCPGERIQLPGKGHAVHPEAESPVSLLGPEAERVTVLLLSIVWNSWQ